MDTIEGSRRAGRAGPDELLSSLLDVSTALSSTPRTAAGTGALEAWSEVVSECQRIVNMATALQDEAMVRLSAIELVVLEDGTIGETHRAAGHVALDAPAIVAGALEVSQVHAERRVRAAVRLAADGQAGTSAATGLGGLHDAMRSGDLDGYRAGVVAEELEEAPPEVAETVVASLGDHLAHETAPQLRRRCRRLLARISPDLLRQRAKRAREQGGLRRWVDEPGVDRWEGSFPSEDAARAWAAIDARAQQLVADGTCERVDRARAQALIDLVTASATITTVVTLTVPAEVTAGSPEEPAAPARHRKSAMARRAAAPVEEARLADLVEAATPLCGEPVLVPRAWLVALTASPETTVRRASCDPVTGALRVDTRTDGYRPPRALATLVKQRDRRCRFPGCSVAARFCDLDHVRPWPAGPTADTNLICLCRRHHRVKQRLGWRVDLAPDGTVTWTDPTGRVRTTLPVDSLHSVVLPEAQGAPVRHGVDEPQPSGPAADTDGDAPHSSLQFALEHLLGRSLTTRRKPAAPRRAPVHHVMAGYAVHDEYQPGCRSRRPRSRPDHHGDDPPF